MSFKTNLQCKGEKEERIKNRDAKENVSRSLGHESTVDSCWVPHINVDAKDVYRVQGFYEVEGRRDHGY